MKKSGFTLVELLAAIVIVAVIVAIAIPSSLMISRRVRKNMFCKKIAMIEQSAVLYGQDNFDLVSAAGSNGAVIKVSDLVISGYLKKDKKDAQVGNGAVIDPRNNNSLDAYQIKLYINNNISKNRVRAVCIENDCNNLCE